jgi:hypothetical protein
MDYYLTWKLNGKILPVLKEDAAELLMSQRDYEPYSCPNSIVTQKGPFPAKAIVTVPYGDMKKYLNDEAGDLIVENTLTIDLSVEATRELEIPETKIEFKNLYVTKIFEFSKYPSVMGASDLVVVELHDIRWFLLKKSGYGPYQIGSTTKVYEDLWDSDLKSIAGGKSLVSTNSFYPEQGTIHNQFYKNEYKGSWEAFNEVLNRTENVFFIDKDGTPVVQKNSYAGEADTYLNAYMSDSMSSETMSTEESSSKDESWEKIKGYFWLNNQRQNFKIEEKTFSSNGIAGSILPVFPVTRETSGTSEYNNILNNYKTELLASRALNHGKYNYNNVIDFDLNSNISSLAYTNNPFGIHTFVDVSFRHGIPFYKYVSDFKSDSIPTASAEFSGMVVKDDATEYEKDDLLRYNRGFYGPHQTEDPHKKYFKNNFTSSEASFNSIRTNDPNLFGVKNSTVMCLDAGFYKYTLSGHFNTTLVGTLNQDKSIRKFGFARFGSGLGLPPGQMGHAQVDPPIPPMSSLKQEVKLDRFPIGVFPDGVLNSSVIGSFSYIAGEDDQGNVDLDADWLGLCSFEISHIYWRNEVTVTPEGKQITDTNFYVEVTVYNSNENDWLQAIVSFTYDTLPFDSKFIDFLGEREKIYISLTSGGNDIISGLFPLKSNLEDKKEFHEDGITRDSRARYYDDKNNGYYSSLSWEHWRNSEPTALQGSNDTEDVQEIPFTISGTFRLFSPENVKLWVSAKSQYEFITGDSNSNSISDDTRKRSTVIRHLTYQGELRIENYSKLDESTTL